MVFPMRGGKYAAVFDDDDILFSNWVEEFKKCAEENEGRILHSFAFAQDWEKSGKNWDIVQWPLRLQTTVFPLI